ncbi:hypothetical protein [Streptomyces showdoensis]|uniref:hypothetical protein n=1 Tax=Streptomyces showdoensis TaxID=68268 RepID=UPI00103C5B3B|nr:hypothetical protein [Streptomyces showdoensis]
MRFLTPPELPGRYGFAERPPTPGVMRTVEGVAPAVGAAGPGEAGAVVGDVGVAGSVGGTAGADVVGGADDGAVGFGGVPPPPEQPATARPRPSTHTVVTTPRARTPTTPPQVRSARASRGRTGS